MDRVRSLAGSDEHSVFCYSLCTPTTMVFLAQKPDYARRVRVYAQMAPSIAADHFTLVPKVYFEDLPPPADRRNLLHAHLHREAGGGRDGAAGVQSGRRQVLVHAPVLHDALRAQPEAPHQPGVQSGGARLPTGVVQVS